MSIDEQPMNVYWSGKRTETSNNFKTNYKGSVADKNNLPSSGNKIGDMYNVTESGENFIWNGSSWDSLSGDTLKTLNWQKTEKAASVSCYPVSETVLESVVDFIFAETGPDSGTKGPDNSSVLTGVSAITVTRCETVGVDSTDYTISLNGTYYGGNVNLSTGIMTVTFSSIVLDGSEDWSLVGSGAFYRYKMLMSSPAPSGEALAPVYNIEKCTHFDIQNSVSYDTQHAIVSGNGITIFTTQTSVETFEAWLAAQATAGTPVCLVWPLATPYTVQLTPTQIYSLLQPDPYTPRLNTIYSDQTSIQVGYAKSPIRSEYELTQAIAAIEGSE